MLVKVPLAIVSLLSSIALGAPTGRNQMAISSGRSLCPRSFSRVVQSTAYGVPMQYGENWDYDGSSRSRTTDAVTCTVRLAD